MIPDACRRSGDVCALTRPPTILETSIRTAGQVFVCLFVFLSFPEDSSNINFAICADPFK